MKQTTCTNKVENIGSYFSAVKINQEPQDLSMFNSGKNRQVTLDLEAERKPLIDIKDQLETSIELIFEWMRTRLKGQKIRLELSRRPKRG